MATTISTTSLNGIYAASKIEMTTISASTQETAITADIGEASDHIYVLIDLSSASSGDYSLECRTGEFNPGGAEKVISLVSGGMNIIPITSKEVKNFDGSANFTLKTTASGGIGTGGVRAAVVKHAFVVNH